MSHFIIDGGHQLGGSITPTGNKNAALAVVAASVLTDQPLHLHNLPDILDVRRKINLVEHLGARITRHTPNDITFEVKDVERSDVNPVDATRIRTAILLAGPLLARRGRVTLPRPGGDMIGNRRLDTHFLALRELGVAIEVTPTSYILQSNKLKGANIFLDERSVTGTEHLLLTTVLCDGESILSNAASEPHIQDLCHCLIQMGAKIEGVGTNVLRVQGVSRLHGAEFTISPDYMEIGSLINLAIATHSEIRIINTRPEDYRFIRMVFQLLGISWREEGQDILVPETQELRTQNDISDAMPVIESMPWPGFPTDLISSTIVSATQVSGRVLFHEKLFDKRLFFTDKLVSMGARIILADPHRALVIGPTQLYGEELTSPDIRAGMALLIAALAAKGRSIIHNIGQIDRGYERIDERLRALGARIERVG